MEESYSNPIEKVTRSMEQLKANLEYGFQLKHKRGQEKNKTQRMIIEKDLRKVFDSIKKDFQVLQEQFRSIELNKTNQNNINKNSNNAFTTKEFERKRNQLNELGNNIKELETSVMNLYNNEDINKAKNLDFSSNNNQNSNQGTNNETKTKKQLFEEQKNELKLQESDIEVLLGTVTNIKNAGMNINNEIDEEKGLLEDIASHVDKNTKKLMDNSKKIEKMLSTVSNQCLVCVIIVEIIIIIVLVIILF